MAATTIRVARSTGERRVIVAYLSLAMIGAGLSFVTALGFGKTSLMERGPALYDLWILLAGAVGAPLALFQFKGRFGHPGTDGLLRAAVGVALVTLAAAIIAGTLILPLYGTMFGPFALGVAFVGAPKLAMLWFGSLAATHLLFGTLQRERDSIFRPRRV